jgi:hypothetical protein
MAHMSGHPAIMRAHPNFFQKTSVESWSSDPRAGTIDGASADLGCNQQLGGWKDLCGAPPSGAGHNEAATF